MAEGDRRPDRRSGSHRSVWSSSTPGTSGPRPRISQPDRRYGLQYLEATRGRFAASRWTARRSRGSPAGPGSRTNALSEVTITDQGAGALISHGRLRVSSTLSRLSWKLMLPVNRSCRSHKKNQ